MGSYISQLDPSLFNNEIDISSIPKLRRFAPQIARLIRKYDGVIYGGAITTGKTDRKYGHRKTDDLDVWFKTKKNLTGFQNEILKLYGKGYGVYKGMWGDSITHTATKTKIMDTHLFPKNYNHKVAGKGYAVIEQPSYVQFYSPQKKMKVYSNGIKGDTYNTAAQRKLSALVHDLQENADWRISKDAFDAGIFNRRIVDQVRRELKNAKDEKKREELKDLLRKYEMAICKLSSDPRVMSVRVKAEKEYLKNGIITKPVFTDRKRMEKEACSCKYIAPETVQKGAYKPYVKPDVKRIKSKPKTQRREYRDHREDSFWSLI